MLQNKLFAKTPIYEQFLPHVERLAKDPVETNVWDIPQTIGELSYLTHRHYRYYGKFPSVVAGQLLTEHVPPKKGYYVFDNFCGSGTTLVEAKLRGIASYGVDIGWISVLVSNVKIRHIDLKTVQRLANSLTEADDIPGAPRSQLDQKFLEKWFGEQAVLDLDRIQAGLLALPKSYERDFLLVGFLAIVRRVSRAFDAEVRPHINAVKKERNAIGAFKKKILDMVEGHSTFQQMTEASIPAECYLGSNTNLTKRMLNDKCYLVISHPPYLNSFNYRPVFSLEYFWGRPFEQDYASPDTMGLNKNELVAHPADETITSQYFEHLESCYQATYDRQAKGGKLAIVIGDCTRDKKLIPVIERTIVLTEEIGYKVIQKNFRTTHYGLGKYAYKHRADYHGEVEQKRDAILVFKK